MQSLAFPIELLNGVGGRGREKIEKKPFWVDTPQLPTTVSQKKNYRSQKAR